MKCPSLKVAITLFIMMAVSFPSPSVAQSAGANEPLLAKSDSLFAKGVELYKAQKYQEAIPLFAESDKIDKAEVDYNSFRRDYSEMWLAACYYQIGDTAKARATNKYYKLPPVDRRLTVKNDSLIVVSIGLLGKGDYKTALECCLQCVELEKSMFGSNHYRYANPLSFAAMCHLFSGKYQESIPIAKEALRVIGQTLGKENEDYATALNNLASFYSALGNYAEGVRLGTEALGIYERTVGKTNPNYLSTLNGLASQYALLGNYEEALKLNTEVLELRGQVLGKDHPQYALSLNGMADLYAKQGDYTKAVRVQTEVMQIHEKSTGKAHPQYAKALNDLATYYSSLGNSTEAMALLTETLGIYEQTLGKDHPLYAAALENLASENYKQKNYEEAIRLNAEALATVEKVVGKGHSDYTTILNNMSIYNFALGNYDEAIRLCAEALNIREQTFGSEHPNYANSLNNLAYDYGHVGNYKEAIELATKAQKIYEKALGKKHPDYVQVLHNLAVYHCEAGDVPSMTAYTMETSRLYTDIISKTFADMTAYERNLFWQKYEFWFTRLVHQIACAYPTDSLLINAYDGTLLSKGLLLNSEMEMSKLLLESGDKDVVEAYKDLQRTRQMLNRLYEKPIAERAVSTDSLERVVNNMERELIQRSKTYGDYTRNLAITWKDVQRRLGKKDVAVEFVSFPYPTDSIMYVAYVLKAGMPVPQAVPLFEASQLAALPKAQYYTTTDVSSLVWGNLDKHLDGADNVYFAPAGELYNIAIESLPDRKDASRRMSDRWNFYRLSSTRELAVTKDKSQMKKAALYGGLRYDTDTRQMEADSKRYHPAETRQLAIAGIADTLQLRGGVKYLPATKQEAEHIDHAMRQAAVHSSLFTDTIGTEASFKNLSGKKTNVLHIATHGFYWNEREARMKDHLNFLMLNEGQSPRLLEDKAMTRSGLLFSGANNALVGKPLPENVEDGILTAKEISVLDLRGLDLVVLSACQTGLGEVMGDGVFGLQRGFKKAGANTILMSLWSVPDAPTQMLMTRFYDNLLARKNPKTGKPFTKFEALNDAQQYVRNYEETDAANGSWKPYEDPRNWAAFILLDAID